jgi:hypothetical protein
MKTQLNEIKRMQQLAGIISESQLNEAEVTPEQAAQEATAMAAKLDASPVIDKVAADIAKDPNASKQLMDLLSKYGVDPSTLSENIDTNAVQKLALVMAKKAEQAPISEEEGGFDYGGAFWTGLVGGGALGHYLFSKETMDFVGGLTHSTAAMPETIAGAILGAIIAVIGKNVYDRIKGNN